MCCTHLPLLEHGHTYAGNMLVDTYIVTHRNIKMHVAHFYMSQVLCAGTHVDLEVIVKSPWLLNGLYTVPKKIVSSEALLIET